MLGIHTHVVHMGEETCKLGDIIHTYVYPISNSVLTVLVSEYRLANRAGPHAQAACQLGGLRVAGEMFAQGALVDIVLSADRTGVVGGSPLAEVAVIQTGPTGVRWLSAAKFGRTLRCK